jgi:hypothetical protein
MRTHETLGRGSPPHDRLSGVTSSASDRVPIVAG